MVRQNIHSAPRDNASYYFGELLSRRLKHQSWPKIRNVAFCKAILVQPYTKMEKWRIPFASREFQFNHSVWRHCPVLWPPNGQCRINSASDEQAGQQNQKWGGGPRCMNYAYYITITLQYTVRQNNAVKIGLRLRYWTISYMVLAYLRSEITLSFLNTRQTHMRFVC